MIWYDMIGYYIISYHIISYHMSLFGGEYIMYHIVGVFKSDTDL